MTYPIYTNIPAANNDPADDQPLMQINNANIAGYLGIDHVAPGALGDGFHQHVTYYNKFPPVAPIIGQVAIGYTNVGIANAAVPENFYTNASGTFPLSCVKAFGSFDTQAPGAVPLINGYNITSITGTTATHYDVVTTAGAISGNNVVIFATCSTTATGILTGYAFVNPTLGINVALATPNGRRINFAILQI